ncbi:hypothetical protein LTR67_003138 [Exophiala xenobiotica]
MESFQSMFDDSDADISDLDDDSDRAISQIFDSDTPQPEDEESHYSTLLEEIKPGPMRYVTELYEYMRSSDGEPEEPRVANTVTTPAPTKVTGRVHALEGMTWIRAALCSKSSICKRELRNAFNTIVALAEFDAEKRRRAGKAAPQVVMERRHLVQVVEMSDDFKKYMKSTRGSDESALAKAIKIIYL